MRVFTKSKSTLSCTASSQPFHAVHWLKQYRLSGIDSELWTTISVGDWRVMQNQLSSWFIHMITSCNLTLKKVSLNINLQHPGEYLPYSTGWRTGYKPGFIRQYGIRGLLLWKTLGSRSVWFQTGIYICLAHSPRLTKDYENVFVCVCCTQAMVSKGCTTH